jgi:hypothetical protein
VTTYKFLAAGAVAPFSGFTWPTPGPDGGVGPWVEVGDDEGLDPCRAGLHICRADDLPYWLNEELFAVETDGPVLAGRSFVLSRRARLSRRMSAWTRDSARRFTEDCAWSVRELTAAALRRAGDESMADDLLACETLANIERCAQPFLAVSDGSARLVGYAADAAAWAARTGHQNWAAACATTALIAASAAAAADPEAGQSAAEAERARQARWLADHVLGAPAGAAA